MPQEDQSYGTIEVVRVQPRRVRRARDGSCCRKVCACLILVFLILIAVLLYIWLMILRPLGWSGTSQQNPDFSKQLFAVGFDLTAGYGTAAVRYPNDTTVTIGTVHGDSDYNQLLAKLSLWSSQHPTPPYYSRGYEADLPRQFHRFLRKKIGLPASKDVAALASVLTPLKGMTEQVVGDFKYAFVTVPYLPAIYNEDLVDACDYVGLQLLTLPWYIFQTGDSAQYPVTEINAAMAGNGLGLCKDFRNSTHCKEQYQCPEHDDMLSVLYTAEALTAHVGPFCDSMHFFYAAGIANFSLGYKYASEFPDAYWPQVRTALKNAMDTDYTRGHELGLVVAYGEGVVHEPLFMSVLRDEVKKAQINNTLPTFSSVDPVYAAARGAAEFGQRCMFPNLNISDTDCIPDLSPRQQGW